MLIVHAGEVPHLLAEGNQEHALQELGVGKPGLHFGPTKGVFVKPVESNFCYKSSQKVTY